MLGVAIAAAKLGLSVEIHRGALLAGDILPANAPQQAQLIHPSVVRELMELHANGQIGIEISALDVEKMRQLLQKQLSLGRYGLVMLDWERWDVEVQKSYGNPRHIVTVFGLNGENVAIMDPARPEGENLVTSPLRRLYAALNDKQQMIFIGPKETNADNNNLV